MVEHRDQGSQVEFPQRYYDTVMTSSE
jgi:hypothetical protein